VAVTEDPEYPEVLEDLVVLVVLDPLAVRPGDYPADYPPDFQSDHLKILKAVPPAE